MLACYNSNKNSTLDYFNCIRTKDSEYSGLTNSLNMRVNNCVIKAEDCVEKCKISFEGHPDQFANCSEKCQKELYSCAKNVSFGFYEDVLKKNKEWGKVKNVIEN